VVAVDPATRTVVPEGQVGELWVSSPGVAAGYWDRDEETRATFGNYLAGGEGPFLDTGDLGFVAGNEVYVTGRRKDLIIIRGRNIYPQDVEAAVERSAGMVHANGCAAFSLDLDSEERLGLVIEADRGVLRATQAHPATVETLVAGIRSAVVREFDVQVSALVLVRTGAFPRTSSGKVMRRACREGLRWGTLDAIYQWGVRTGSNVEVSTHETGK
jgi:acyl-CoA synthetase (AMP-forming)/AMP-acid ligase II